MAYTPSDGDRAAAQPLIAIVDSQRLRRDALAAALALRGLATVSSATAPDDAALLVLREDHLEQLPVYAGSPPHLLIASSRPHARVLREGRKQAVGVVPAGASVGDLLAAVMSVLAGARPTFSPAVTPAGNDQDVLGRVHSLSPRERTILVELASGRRNPEIAALLGISTNTVRTHVQNIFSKLDVDNRGAAVAAARRAGLLLERDVPG